MKVSPEETDLMLKDFDARAVLENKSRAMVDEYMAIPEPRPAPPDDLIACVREFVEFNNQLVAKWNPALVPLTVGDQVKHRTLANSPVMEVVDNNEGRVMVRWFTKDGHIFGYPGGVEFLADELVRVAQ